jgi:hypothetical protein
MTEITRRQSVIGNRRMSQQQPISSEQNVAGATGSAGGQAMRRASSLQQRKQSTQPLRLSSTDSIGQGSDAGGGSGQEHILQQRSSNNIGDGNGMFACYSVN